MEFLGRLRDVSDHDLELMLIWRNEPAVRRNMYTRHEISLDEHLKWWERTKGRADQKYFIYEFEGTPTGVVSLNDINESHGNTSWAFYSSPEAPRGTGSKMEFLALDYVFSVLKLHRIYCEVLDFNHPVINLHKKFGFRVEGVMRQHHKYDGEYIDVYQLGMLDEDWSEYRPKMEAKILSRAGA